MSHIYVHSEPSEPVRTQLTSRQQLLNAGLYYVSIIFGENQRYVLFNIIDCISFEVMQESTGSNSNKLPGIIFPKLVSISSFKPME